MADYIDREKTEEAIQSLTIVDATVAAYAEAVLFILRRQPSADVEPVVHARWVDKGWAGDSNWGIDGRGNCWRVLECSHCKGQLCGRPKSLRCLYCGAMMEVEQQNESN